MRLILAFMLMAGIVTAEKAAYPKADTPQNAMRIYFQSLQNADKATFKTTIHASKGFVEAMSKTVDLVAALKTYENAVKLKFKDDKTAQGLIANMVGLKGFERQADTMKVKIDKSRAVSVPQYKGEIPVDFILIDGRWKMDYSKMEKNNPHANIVPLAMERAIPRIKEKIVLLIKELETSSKSVQTLNLELSKTITETIQTSAMEVMHEQHPTKK